jgi:hypothetical protein
MESLQYTDTFLMVVAALAGIATLTLALFFKGRHSRSQSRFGEISRGGDVAVRSWWLGLATVVAAISAVIAIVLFFLQR